MWALGVVVDPPAINFLAGVAERSEPMELQAFVSELCAERLEEGVLHRLARLDKTQAYAGELRQPPISGTGSLFSWRGLQVARPPSIC